MTISITGQSFMVYQIRHMMAVAISVATGKLPSDFVDISLSLPARVKLPLAPPMTLVLHGCTFQPFPVSNNQGQHPLAALNGDTLELRSEGRDQQQMFSEQVLNADLDSLLKSEEWEASLGRMTSETNYDPEDWSALFMQWREHNKFPDLEES